MHSITRRATFIFLGGAALAACTGGQIDPQKILDTLKQACGIVVPLATIVAVVNASVGPTVNGVVDLLCSGFKQTVAAQKLGGALKEGQTIDYVVTVNGKDIPVTATVQH